MPTKQWQAMLDVHLTAPFRLIQAAAPYMRDAAKAEIDRDGKAAPRSIINVSSTSGTHGNAGQVNYGTVRCSDSHTCICTGSTACTLLVFALILKHIACMQAFSCAAVNLDPSSPLFHCHPCWSPPLPVCVRHLPQPPALIS